MGRSLAFKRPWSASTRLLAYWVVSCSAAGRRSVTTRTKAWARSVVISTGWPWAVIIEVKNSVVALRSRFFDKNTSMTCPDWSTAQ